MKCFALASLLAGVAPTGASVPDPPAASVTPVGPLSLRTARQQARWHWAASKAPTLSADAQRALVEGAWFPDDPVVSAQVWQLPLNGVEGSLMPGMTPRQRAWNAVRGPDMLPLMVMVSQAFPWPGRKVAEHDEAAAQVKSREAGARRVDADVQKAVAYAFAEAVATAAIRNQLVASVKDVERMRAWAETRLQSGLGSTQEVVALQAERDALEAALIDARWQQAVAHARLAAMTGVAPGTEVTVEEVQVAAPNLPARDLLVDRALAARPEMEEARAGLMVAGARARRERASVLPDITANAAYMVNVGGAGMLMDQGPHMALLGPADTVTVGVSVPVPVFGPWKQGGRVRGAQLGQRSAEAEVEALSRMSALEVDEALAALDHARAHVALHQDTLLPRALEAQRLAEAGYASGSVDAATVLTAARAVRAQTMENLRYQLELARHLADLERLTGLSLLKFGVAPLATTATPAADEAPPTPPANDTSHAPVTP